MARQRYMLNDLSEEKYALIGRAIRSFAALEHELGRAIIGLLGGPTIVMANLNLEDRANRLLQDMLSGRAREFVALCKQRDPKLEAWADDFGQKLEDGTELRNAFAHGLWESAENDRLRLTFYHRKCFANSEQPKVWEFTLLDLQEIDTSNLINVCLLGKHFAPPET